VGAAVVSSQDELRNAIQKAGAGTEVTLKVVRAGRELDIKARPQPMPVGIDLPHGLAEPHTGHGQRLLESLHHLPALEKQVQELERRLREVEQKLPR
jgi:hypothetical protein